MSRKKSVRKKPPRTLGKGKELRQRNRPRIASGDLHEKREQGAHEMRVQGEQERSSDDLERILASKIQPAVDAIMQKFMGVRIQELGSDLTAKLVTNPLLGFDVNTLLPYKDALKRFRRQYVRRLLIAKYGNVSEVARIAKVERRSIHRFIIEAKIDVARIRHEMLKPSYVRSSAIEQAFLESLRAYEGILHPDRLKQFYEDVPRMSEELVKELPDDPLPLAQAEQEFQKRYFRELLNESKTVAEAARRSGLRYETVHRKLKGLHLIR